MSMSKEMEHEEALFMSASFVLGILLAGFVYWRTGDAQRVWIILESVVATQVIFRIARVAIMKDRDKNSKAERNGFNVPMNDSNSTKE